MRAACAGHRLDLTEVTETSPAADLDEARALCAGCPILASCRRNALRVTDYAGFAGGMTETERDTWRARNGVTVTPVDIVDATPARALTTAVVDDLPELTNGVPAKVVALVLRMTQAHMSAEEIVDRLDHPAVTHRTVKYIRHRYAKGPTRVDA